MAISETTTKTPKNLVVYTFCSLMLETIPFWKLCSQLREGCFISLVLLVGPRRTISAKNSGKGAYRYKQNTWYGMYPSRGSSQYPQAQLSSTSSPINVMYEVLGFELRSCGDIMNLCRTWEHPMSIVIKKGIWNANKGEREHRNAWNLPQFLENSQGK